MLCVKRSVPNVPTATTFFENHFKKTNLHQKCTYVLLIFLLFWKSVTHVHTGFSDLTWVGISE